MSGHVAGIFRHPVKGFTPEPLQAVALAPGRGFPHDRIWAVENGPSGFDPAAPAFVPKQKFTVLAQIAQVAAARTRYDPESGVLHASAPGTGEFVGRLADSDRKEYERRIKRLADQHRGYWKGERVIRQEDGTPLMYVRSAGR